MNHRKIISFFATCFLFLNNCNACSFIPDSFCKTANFYQTEDLIIMAEISDMDTLGITVDILEVLKGDESRSSIRIWDGTDFYCNGTHSMAASSIGNLGDTVILILPEISSIENTWDIIGDYRRPDPFTQTTCLKVRDDFVNGYIHGSGIFPSSGINAFALDDFLSTSISEMGCEVIVSTKVIESDRLQIFPNPAGKYITVKYRDGKYLHQLKIVDSRGKVILKLNANRRSSTLNIQSLLPGLYAIVSEENKAYHFIKQ